MEQYISKAALVAEIEKLINRYKTCQTRSSYEDGLKEGRLIGYEDALYKINTLEVKEVDFEKELDKEWNKCEPIDEGMGLEIASIEHEQFDNIAKHFFELGLKAQKGGIEFVKYINVEKLKDKIESISLIPQTSADYNDGRNDMKMMFLDIIDSLQQEKPKGDLEEKASQLSQKYFPDEENIWARPNIEAQKCKSACIEMVEWLKAQKRE